MENDAWKKEPELIENSTRYCGIWYAHFDSTRHKVPPGMYVFTYQSRAETATGIHTHISAVVCRSAADFLKLLVVWNAMNPSQYIYYPVGIDLAVK